MGTRRIPSAFVTGLVSPRTAVRVGLVVLLESVIWLFLELPAFIEFGVAVAAAIAWSLFLESDLTGTNTRPEPTPGGGTRADTRPGTPAPSLRIVAVSKRPDRPNDAAKAA